MKKYRPVSAIALAAALGWAVPAAAETSSETEALRAELAQMRQQMEAMADRIDVLEGELEAADAKADAAGEAAMQASAQAEAASVAAAEPAPVAELSKDDGDWSFKPFGRLQVDAGTVSSPDGVSDAGLGFANEVRRARIGVQGDIAGGFGYKIEVDFAEGGAELTDALLTYEHKDLEVTIGQHNTFQSLEELTSSRFLSFMERAAFTDAFGFERRVGVSGQVTSGDLLVQAGVFTDSIADLDSDENNSLSVDGRAVFAPKAGDTQLHFGGSLHWRDLNDAGQSVRYRQRPHVHFTDTRFIDTSAIPATGEFGAGLEAAAISGPFHAVAEAYWQSVKRPMMDDPTFFGGYAEIGYFLTGGDRRGYKGFKFDRTKPANPVGEGGLGALQINLRYDYLDLTDGAVVGGTQNGYAVSLVWTPTDFTRFLIDYGHMSYDDAAILSASGSSYGVDTFGMRAQFDF